MTNVILYFLDFDQKFRYSDSDKYIYDVTGYHNIVRFACAPPSAFPPIKPGSTSVIWLRNGKRIKDKKIKEEVIYVNGILADTIEFTAKRSYAGSYSCNYAHIAGSRSHTMKLIVTGMLSFDLLLVYTLTYISHKYFVYLKPSGTYY